MKKMSHSFIPGVVLALICVAPLHAQTPDNAPADTNPTAAIPAPDDVVKKLSELVRAGKYSEAQQLTAALLLAFPDDQRLIKAKALLDKTLVTAEKKGLPPPVTSSASVAPARTGIDAKSSAPMNNPVPVSAQPGSPPTVILHLYRPHHLTAAMQKPDVYIDGNKITQIANSQAIQMVVAPGKHTISVSKRGIESEVPISNFDMGAGKEYWVRVEISAGAWAAHSKLFLVPSDQALSESNRMEEIKLGNVTSN
jgi:Protein of unknown function (DUF2846)